eukprot:CAMPEP_0203818728 /NCGR_PEP_ID=MMETSP0115-20131106/32572_1 /ASSEMBLY_ACC=CAM_ASM_000227 /TAXON_ID=33651 /ORGANISM="Bicosoecid sp, Strain ms1" /LENGTH=121 /DNA_ID=CAMNT_0050727697 /DNA_START=222 /DNA_END=584 /DNA_ORIENTATION=+
MAFDDLAFRSSMPETELEKGWCPVCFAVWDVDPSDTTCPSCAGPVRRITPDDASRAAGMVARVHTLMDERLGRRRAASGGEGAEGAEGGGEGGAGAGAGGVAGMATLFGPMAQAIAGLSEL